MVKKISRKVLVLLAVFCLMFAVVLTGCGGSSSPAGGGGYCGCGDNYCQYYDDCGHYFDCTDATNCNCGYYDED